MKINDFIPIFLEVIKDWRVIATIIVMIFVVSITKSIMTYRRKPKKVKISKKNTSMPKESVKKDNNQEENEEIEE